jgi:hypothetical protein
VRPQSRSPNLDSAACNAGSLRHAAALGLPRSKLRQRRIRSYAALRPRLPRHDPHAPAVQGLTAGAVPFLAGAQAYANSKGVKLIGDMPIYVGGHSADVWANRHLFELNDQGLPDQAGSGAASHAHACPYLPGIHMHIPACARGPPRGLCAAGASACWRHAVQQGRAALLTLFATAPDLAACALWLCGRTICRSAAFRPTPSRKPVRREAPVPRSPDTFAPRRNAARQPTGSRHPASHSAGLLREDTSCAGTARKPGAPRACPCPPRPALARRPAVGQPAVQVARAQEGGFQVVVQPHGPYARTVRRVPNRPLPRFRGYERRPPRLPPPALSPAPHPPTAAP